MSLLLDALKRSEQRPLSLAPADDAAPVTQAPEPVVPPPPAPEATPPQPARPAPAAAAAREAAHTMVHAAAASDPRARTRRMVFGLLAGLALSVVSWLGWNYWQASQGGLMAVALPPVAPVAAPPEPGPAEAASEAGAAQAAETQAAPLPAESAASVAAPAVPAPAPAVVAAPEPLAPVTRKPASEAVSARAKPSAAERAAAVSAPQGAGGAESGAPERTAPAGRDAVAPGRPRPAAAPAAPALVRSLAQRHLQDAWAALGQGDAARAQALYRQVLAERPDDPDATLGLAVALHRQKQLQEAWAAYQRSLQLWPDNATARTGLLAILSESDPATAESRLQEWVQARPRDAAAQAALGNLLGRQGRWAEALGPLTLAQSLAPEQAAYAYNLAVALDQSRRYAEALRLYRQALQLGGAGIPVKSIEYRQAELQELLSQ